MQAYIEVSARLYLCVLSPLLSSSFPASTGASLKAFAIVNAPLWGIYIESNNPNRR